MRSRTVAETQAGREQIEVRFEQIVVRLLDCIQDPHSGAQRADALPANEGRHTAEPARAEPEREDYPRPGPPGSGIRPVNGAGVGSRPEHRQRERSGEGQQLGPCVLDPAGRAYQRATLAPISLSRHAAHRSLTTRCPLDAGW
jgi:hypothetical protein